MHHVKYNKEVINAFKWLPVHALRRHERTRPEAITALVKALHKTMRDPHATPPTIPAVLVCDQTYTIIDGHHRFEALKALGCAAVPAMLLNYKHPDIVLRSPSDILVTKDDVVDTALSSEFMEPKQTAHLVRELDSGLLLPLPVLSPTCPVVPY